MEIILKKEINAILLEVSELVVLVVEKLKDYSINNEAIADIEIALAEALTNIVKHGYHYQINKKIEMFLYKADDLIGMKITDYADEVKLNFNKKLEYDPEDTESLPEGGMGLYLMNNCMTKLSIERIDNKNILTMIKKI